MKRGRIARGRATRRSAVADAFFAALAGGHDQAVKCLAGELGEAGKEVRDYLVSAD